MWNSNLTVFYNIWLKKKFPLESVSPVLEIK